VVKRKYGDKFGPDMKWFFDQTLYGTGVCDYKVANFYNNKIEPPQDTIINRDSLNENLKINDQYYRSVVELERVGEVMLPVDILVHFNDGNEVTESWDGKNRFKDFVYVGTRRIDWVKLDPEYKIRMDINYVNNSMTQNPDPIPLRRLTSKFISFMQFFISFISL